MRLSIADYNQLIQKSWRNPSPIAEPAPEISPKQAMNKTEIAYAQHLEMLKYAGEIIHYEFEPLKLRLAKDTTYTPDFLIVRPAGIELHEVKGFWRDDARVKFKVAADKFFYWKFIAVKRIKGEWVYEVL